MGAGGRGKECRHAVCGKRRQRGGGLGRDPGRGPRPATASPASPRIPGRGPAPPFRPAAGPPGRLAKGQQGHTPRRRRPRNLRRLKWVASRRRFRRSQRVGGNVMEATIRGVGSQPCPVHRPRIRGSEPPCAASRPEELTPTQIPHNRARRGLSRAVGGCPVFGGTPGVVRRLYGAYSAFFVRGAASVESR